MINIKERKRITLGIDIGGTKVNMGLIDQDGKVVDSHRINTPSTHENKEAAIALIAKEAKKLVTQNNLNDTLHSIGIGVPGSVDDEKGMVIFAPNLGWENIEIVEIFNEQFQVPIYLTQDTTAAVLGEWYFGSGKDLTDFICISIGTGIGSGLVLNSQHYPGSFQTAGEIGHTIAKHHGTQCGCGKSGCLETVASGTGILTEFRNLLQEKGYTDKYKDKTISSYRTEDIFALAKHGDTHALQVIDQATTYLAAAIVNAANLLSFQKVILTGGLSLEEELFMKPIKEKVKRQVYALLADKLVVETAILKDNAPMIGAAMLYKKGSD